MRSGRGGGLVLPSSMAIESTLSIHNVEHQWWTSIDLCLSPSTVSAPCTGTVHLFVAEISCHFLTPSISCALPHLLLFFFISSSCRCPNMNLHFAAVLCCQNILCSFDVQKRIRRRDNHFGAVFSCPLHVLSLALFACFYYLYLLRRFHVVVS